MSDSELYIRIGQLERDVARLDENFNNLKEDMTALLPLAVDMAVIKRDVRDVKEAVRQVQMYQRDKDERDSTERRDLRRSLLLLSGTVITAVGAVIAAIITQGPS